MGVVGKNVPHDSAVAYVTGEAQYIDDVPPANDSVGGPQLMASWLFPVIPATPATFRRFAKNGVACVESLLN